MPTPAGLIELYATGPAKLRAVVADMTAEQVRARPIAGKWSTLEVVAHIADFEPVFADRIRRVVALEKPLLLAADENDFARHLLYHDRDANEELDLIDATRKATARLLRTLPAEVWARQGVHSLKGLLTLEQVLTAAANHIPHHLTFVAEKRKALGLS